MHWKNSFGKPYDGTDVIFFNSWADMAFHVMLERFYWRKTFADGTFLFESTV